jgi:hypothetical protein
VDRSLNESQVLDGVRMSGPGPLEELLGSFRASFASLGSAAQSVAGEVSCRRGRMERSRFVGGVVGWKGACWTHCRPFAGWGGGLEDSYLTHWLRVNGLRWGVRGRLVGVCLSSGLEGVEGLSCLA